MLDALIEAIIAGRLTYRQARVALAIATGRAMGKRRLAALTGIDAADCRRTLRELEALGWLPVDNSAKEGGETPPSPVDNSVGWGVNHPPEGGETPPGGGQITPQGGVKHPPEGESPPAGKPATDEASRGRGVNHPPSNSGSGSSHINTTTTTTPDALNDLVFPRSFTPEQQNAARRMLAGLGGMAQALLDEVAGREAIHPIKNPLAYLRGLVRRAQAGDFVAEAGVAVTEARLRQEAMQRAIKEANDAYLDKLKRTPPPGGSLKAALEAIRRQRSTT